MLKASKHEANLKMRSPLGSLQTTTLIGGRCTGGNVLSRAVLITRKLSQARMRAARDKCGKPFSVLYGLSEEVAAGSRGVAFPRWSFFQHDSRRGALRRVRAAKV